MAVVFKLPDLGENIDSAEVVAVSVAVGDVVAVDQTLIEVETDKAVTDVPSPVAGKLVELAVSVGDKLAVGDVIATIEDGDADQGADDAQADDQRPTEESDESGEDEAEQPGQAESRSADGRKAAGGEDTKSRGDEAEPSEQVKSRSDDGRKSAGVEDADSGEASVAPPTPAADDHGERPVPAAPSVRKFAREIGVDVSQVHGSGPAGRISIEDVKAHARNLPVGGPRGAPRKALPDFRKWGEVERQRMSNVRKKTALQMETGWQAPHVTLHDKADVTALETFRRQYKGTVEQAGGKLTITAMLLRITSAALNRFPALNCSIDMAQDEVIYKKYVNVGVAVDTPRGLVVPVILHADRKTVTQLSVELTETAAKARKGKLSLEEMSGGTFTITNLGGIGIGHFTPIINDPEVAILGIGRSQYEPVYVDGQFQPRLMMPLSLSFDHRIVDGADGARFLRWIVQAMEQPLLLVMEG